MENLPPMGIVAAGSSASRRASGNSHQATPGGAAKTNTKHRKETTKRRASSSSGGRSHPPTGKTLVSSSSESSELNEPVEGSCSSLSSSSSSPRKSAAVQREAAARSESMENDKERSTHKGTKQSTSNSPDSSPLRRSTRRASLSKSKSSPQRPMDQPKPPQKSATKRLHTEMDESSPSQTTSPNASNKVVKRDSQQQHAEPQQTLQELQEPPSVSRLSLGGASDSPVKQPETLSAFNLVSSLGNPDLPPKVVHLRLKHLHNLCLGKSTSDDDAIRTRKVVREMGGALRIVQTMQQHSSQWDIQEIGCVALQSLSFDEGCDEGIVLAGGMRAALAAIRSFPDRDMLIHHALTLILNLMVGEPRTTSWLLQEKEAMTTLMQVMKRHGDKVHIQDPGCGILHRIVFSDNVKVNVSLLEGGALEVLSVTERMGRTWSKPDMIQEAREAILLLVSYWTTSAKNHHRQAKQKQEES